VAGERGRQSNYLYGSAKAGFTAYLSGLRNRLYPHGVHVLTVKPGFVKTRMIENLKTPGPLTASPKKVAEKISKALVSKTNTLYVLPVWRIIMGVIRMIPEAVFKRLKL
jgi:decaprenylphospho-beta-D-erythro-pentofuranosid-2-ulose 2-reductase